MADLVITPANVDGKIAGTLLKAYVLAEAVDAGEVCHLDSNNQAALAQCDGTAQEGVARILAVESGLSGASTLFAIPSSVIDIGATLTVGDAFYLSANPGKIMPPADLLTGNKITLVGIAVAQNRLQVLLQNTGFTK